MKELIIQLPDNYTDNIYTVTNTTIRKALINARPLPEHHGDLKDVSQLAYDCSYNNGSGCDRICYCDNCSYSVVRESDIKNLPTIIPQRKKVIECR